MRLTLGIVGKTLFGADVEDQAPEVGAALTAVMESFWTMMLPFADLLERLPVPSLRKSRLARARLDAIIYEMAARRMLFGRFSVSIRGRRLYGTAWGESIQPRHAPACEPKAATMTELRVARDASGHWSAGCIVDV